MQAHDERTMSGPTSKRPRFDVRNPSALAPDAPEEDAVLDADVIGTRAQQVKRNAVNIDGYDSDSENEGFDGRVEAKAKQKEAQSRDEEVNDMFADLEEDFRDEGESDRNAAGRRKKKAVRFLTSDEIEGQIESSRSGGHVSADFSINGHGKAKAKGKAGQAEDTETSSESEVDDVVRASTGDDVDEELGAGGKKIHAPRLDAFNMKEEQEEGRFDEQGNYVRKAADPDAKYDNWLEGVSKRDMKKAKEASDKRDEEQRKQSALDDAVLTSDLLKRLIPRLEKGETVLEALARLGSGKEKKTRWQNRQKNRKKQVSDIADADMAQDDSAELQRKEAVEAITDAADKLLTRGQTEIYEAERELLIRQFRRETGEDWVDLPQGALEAPDGAGATSKLWEYRWVDQRDGGEIHGPYEGALMAQWNEAGYFSEGVEFRPTDGRTEWSRLVDFV